MSTKRETVSKPKYSSPDYQTFNQSKQLYNLMQIMQGLEMAFTNAAGHLTDEEYSTQCMELITKYNTMVLPKTKNFNLQRFAKEHNLEDSALAVYRLKKGKTSLEENKASKGMGITCYRWVPRAP